MHLRFIINVGLVSVLAISVLPAAARSKIKLVAPETVAEMRRTGQNPTIIEIALGSRTAVIHGAQKVPMSKLEGWAKNIEKNRFIVAYCTCSKDQAATSAVRKLQSMGFTNVHLFDGGLAAWNAMVKARQQEIRERANR